MTIKKNLHPNELQLFEGIDTILRNDQHWLSGFAPEEYRHCHREIFQLVLGDISLTALTQYLHDITVEKIGLQSQVTDHLPTAEAILALKSKLLPVK